MIADLGLRWVLTVVFTIAAGYWLISIVDPRRGDWTGVVARGLHLVMAIAMGVMAWPYGAALNSVAAIVVFIAAAGWFIWALIALVQHRVANGYHALMMLAMAAMYVSMNRVMSAGGSGGHDHQMAMQPGDSGQMQMAGMGMPGMDAPSNGAGGWVGVLSWICTIGFAVAALVWTYRYFAVRQGQFPHNRHHNGHHHFGMACQAMMAAGMAVMYGAML